MIAAVRSEWVLLNRARLWAGLGLVTASFTTLATWLVIGAAEPASQAGEFAITLEGLSGAGGATSAVVTSAGFSSVLVFAAFAASAASDFARGTFRVALTHQPRRWSLIAGKLVARLGVAAVVAVMALAVGWLAAAVAAPGTGIDTRGWFGLDAVAAAAVDLGRIGLFVTGFALLGTTVAVLVRSTPIALAIGLLWFGPIENVIGDELAWAPRWFPGLLLRTVLRPDMPGSVTLGTALSTLALYGAVTVAVAVVVLTRRDVTS